MAVARWLILVLALLQFGIPARAEGDAIRGEPNAPVTILMFSAFRCPYCAEASRTLAELQAKYPGRIAIIFKHFPLSERPRDILPHLAAEAASEQGGFWKMHDLIFANQTNPLERPELEGFARQAHLDIRSFKRSLDQPAARARVAADQAEARALKVVSVPTFYVDGFKLEGLQSREVFEQIIEFRLAALPGNSASGSDGLRAVINPDDNQLPAFLRAQSR